MVPEVITYSVVISACEKGKQPEWALEVFQAMQRQGMVPNVITYSAVISACEKCWMQCSGKAWRPDSRRAVRASPEGNTNLQCPNQCLQDRLAARVASEVCVAK